MAAQETVFRVLIRLSDRKAEWIQRGTGNVSLPGLPGGAGSQLRNRSQPAYFPGQQGIIREFCRIWPLAGENGSKSHRNINALAANSLRAITGNAKELIREDKTANSEEAAGDESENEIGGVDEAPRLRRR